MTSWLTTHYSHPKPDRVSWHIYLKPEHRDIADSIAVGDRVFFYELKSQKPLKDGPRRPLGAEGIVRVAIVNGLTSRHDERVEYTDGRIEHWCWEVPTTDEDTNGFVAREQLLKLLEYKPGYTLRGFNGGKGVKELAEEQADALLKLFKSGAPGAVAMRYNHPRH